MFKLSTCCNVTNKALCTHQYVEGLWFHREILVTQIEWAKPEWFINVAETLKWNYSLKCARFKLVGCYNTYRISLMWEAFFFFFFTVDYGKTILNWGLCWISQTAKIHNSIWQNYMDFLPLIENFTSGKFKKSEKKWFETKVCALILTGSIYSFSFYPKTLQITWDGVSAGNCVFYFIFFM